MRAVETVVKDQSLDPLDIAFFASFQLQRTTNKKSQHGVSAVFLQVALRSNAFNISLVGIFQADPDEHDATMAYDRYLLVLPLQGFKNTCDHQM